MSKIGLISKHIVLTIKDNTHPRYPMPAIILISNDIIEDIVILDTDELYATAFTLYNDREIIDCTDLYISPGIIDINVRREWEDFRDLTKSAIKGGVTVIGIEEGYYSNFETSSEYYCDVARVAVINDSTDFCAIPKSISALKAYFFPPSQQIRSVANLQNVLMKALNTGLPLFIDATLPEQRMLYMASPSRLESLEERKEFEIKNSKLFAAAFPNAMHSSNESTPKDIKERNANNSDIESDSDSDDSMPPRSFSLHTNEIMKLHSKDDNISDEEHTSSMTNKPVPLILEAKEAEESSPLKNPIRKKESIHDIYDDLNNRIKASQQNIVDLCIAEKSTYSNSGSTLFQNLDVPTKASSLGTCFTLEKSTESDSSEPGSAPLSSKPIRKTFARPSPILIKADARPDSSRDYKYHLANYPEY